MKNIKLIDDFCVICGRYTPEGTQVCDLCKKEYLGEYEEQIRDNNIGNMDASLHIHH